MTIIKSGNSEHATTRCFLSGASIERPHAFDISDSKWINTVLYRPPAKWSFAWELAAPFSMRLQRIGSKCKSPSDGIDALRAVFTFRASFDCILFPDPFPFPFAFFARLYPPRILYTGCVRSCAFSVSLSLYSTFKEQSRQMFKACETNAPTVSLPSPLFLIFLDLSLSCYIVFSLYYSLYYYMCRLGLKNKKLLSL